jgi:hypothetical protein
MLSATLVLEIRRLLNEGELSRRAISRKCGVSRSTVYAIANGKCGVDGRMLELKACEQEPRLKRCQECGGLVVQPCVLCRARAYRRRQAELSQLVTALRRETAFPLQIRLHQRG